MQQMTTVVQLTAIAGDAQATHKILTAAGITAEILTFHAVSVPSAARDQAQGAIFEALHKAAKRSRKAAR